jgi:hypothetical protein
MSSAHVDVVGQKASLGTGAQHDVVILLLNPKGTSHASETVFIPLQSRKELSV